LGERKEVGERERRQKQSDIETPAFRFRDSIVCVPYNDKLNHVFEMQFGEVSDRSTLEHNRGSCFTTSEEAKFLPNGLTLQVDT